MIFIKSTPCEMINPKTSNWFVSVCFCFVPLPVRLGKSMITKKGDGSQVKEKESTDSSTTIEDDEVKGECVDETQTFIISSPLSIFFREFSIFKPHIVVILSYLLILVNNIDHRRNWSWFMFMSTTSCALHTGCVVWSRKWSCHSVIKLLTLSHPSLEYMMQLDCRKL